MAPRLEKISTNERPHGRARIVSPSSGSPVHVRVETKRQSGTQAPKKSVLSRNPKNHVPFQAQRARSRHRSRLRSRRDDRRGRTGHLNAYALDGLRAQLGFPHSSAATPTPCLNGSRGRETDTAVWLEVSSVRARVEITRAFVLKSRDGARRVTNE